MGVHWAARQNTQTAREARLPYNGVMSASLTQGIADFVARDWSAVRAAKDDYWAARIRRLGPLEGLRIADELRRQMLAIDPRWPSEVERQRDLASHHRLAELLRRADRARGGRVAGK